MIKNRGDELCVGNQNRLRMQLNMQKAGLTSFEIADRLSKDYGVKITSSSVRNELNRRHASLHHRRWNADGVQTSTTILSY